MTKAWSGAPFGSQSTRFSINGLHPNMLVSGFIPYEPTYVSQPSAKLGPGSYDILPYADFSDKNVTKRADGPNWERSLYTEKMAKIPHLLFRETHNKRKEIEKRLGPGYYDIKGGLETDELKPRCRRGMLDALSKRFTNENINENPGPCEYGVPDAKLEEKKWTQGGKVPLFERSKQSRSLPSVGCEVPPGAYNHKSTIDELIKKKVSNRGPYDLFSINRSASPKTGHYTRIVKWNLGPGQYSIPSFTDDLTAYNNRKRGKFGKIAQYPAHSGDRISIEHTGLQPRYPEFPGPGSYTPGELSDVKSNPPPFLISTNRNDKRSQKFFLRNFNPVGVGRYDIQKIEEADNKNGNKSVFQSKTKRITDGKDEKWLKERLKPHNLDNERKKNLYLTGNVNGRVVTA